MSNAIAVSRRDRYREDCHFIRALWEQSRNQPPLSAEDVNRYGLHPGAVGFLPFDTGDTWEIFSDVFLRYDAFLSSAEHGEAAARVLSILRKAQDRGLLYYIDTVSQNKLFFVKFREDIDYSRCLDTLLTRYSAGEDLDGAWDEG